jgi:glycosyltransferase involved in cell wall biosynthesis
MRSQRDVARRRLGIREGDLVIATLGTDHPSHLAEPVRRAVLAVVAQHAGRVVVLELGARSLRFSGANLGGATVLTPGPQPAEQLAAELSAADVFLAALLDGASTRRGTLMAALQHGLAVVATSGPLTDRVLREARDALTLIPLGDTEGFATAVADLCADPKRQRIQGVAARELYVREFDWPIVADRLLATIEAISPAGPRDPDLQTKVTDLSSKRAG